MKRIVLFAAVAGACASSPSQPGKAAAMPVATSDIAGRWAELGARYDKARSTHDDASAERLLSELGALSPTNPQITYARARLAAERGDSQQALRELAHYATLGLTLPHDTSPAITALLGNASGAPIASQLAANALPHGDAHLALTLPPGDKLFEDIVWDADAKLFYVTSVRDRRVYAIGMAGGEPRALTVPEADGVGVLGVALDVARHTLWLATAPMAQVPGYRKNDEATRASALVAVDPATGRELRRLELRPDGKKHGFTDLALTSAGDVLVSDAVGGGLYIARVGARALKLLALDFTSPQTPATRDAITAYVPDYSLGIARVDLATGAESWLTAPDDVVLVGIDGLYSLGDTLLAIQNGTAPTRVLQLDLAPDGASVVRATVLASSPEIGDPTHAAIVGGELWFLGNSGWARLDDAGKLITGGPDDHPTIWRVPIARR